MNAIEKAKEAFEKWLRSYCFQAPPDRDYQLMKDAFMEGAGFAALEAEKPAESARECAELVFGLSGGPDDLDECARIIESYHAKKCAECRKQAAEAV